MAKKKKTGKPSEIPSLEKHPVIKSVPNPEEPLLTEENADIIPDEELEETLPYEAPPAGEGP